MKDLKQFFINLFYKFPADFWRDARMRMETKNEARKLKRAIKLAHKKQRNDDKTFIVVRDYDNKLQVINRIDFRYLRSLGVFHGLSTFEMIRDSALYVLPSSNEVYQQSVQRKKHQDKEIVILTRFAEYLTAKGLTNQHVHDYINFKIKQS